MAYESRLELTVDSRTGEQSLQRVEKRLHGVDRAGENASESTSKVGRRLDQMATFAKVAGGALLGMSAGTSVLLALGRQASQTAAEIQKLSRIAGTSTGEFQRLAYGAAQYGVEQGKLADIIRDTQDRIGDFLQTGAGEFVDFFEQIAPKANLSAEALARMSGPDALQAVYNALENAGLSASEMTFYMEALASDATELIPLLRDSGAEVDRLGREAEELNAVLSDLELQRLKDIRNEFHQFEQQLSTETARAVSQFDELIKSSLEGISWGINNVARGFNAFMDDFRENEAKRSIAGINSELDRLFDAKARLEERISLFGEDSAQAQDAKAALADLKDEYDELIDRKKEIQQAGQPVTEPEVVQIARASTELKTLNEWLLPVPDRMESVATSTETAADAASGYASKLDSLRKRLDPAYAASQRLAESTAILDRGLASSALTLNEYLNLWDKAAETFIEARNGSDEATDDINYNTDEMATLWERRLERMDDAAVDMWGSFLDGSEDAFSSFKRLAIDTLAEVIHAYTTQRITANIGANFGIGGSQGGLGGSGGGFGGIPGLGTAANKAAGWLGLGGSSVGAAGTAAIGYGSGFGAAASTGAYTGWAGSAAAGAASSGGIMSGIGAAMPWVGGGLLVDQVLDLGIVDGIVEGISSLFGGGESDLDLAMVRGRDESAHTWDHGIVAQGGLGAVGFQDEGSHEVADLWDIDEAQQLVDSIAQLDTAVASLAETPEQLAAMRDAVLASNRHGIQGHYGETSHPDEVVDRLTSRYTDAFGALDDEFAEFMLGLDGSIEEVVQRGVAARQAFTALSDASERLDLRFDDTTASAYEAASSLAEMAGGTQQLTSLQQNYYQTLYSEEERLNQLRSDVTQQINAMGMSLPRSRDGFRELVEAQDLNTEAGQRNYTQLLQLVDSFDRLAESGALVNAEVAKLDDQIASLKDDVRSAWETFDKQQLDQRVQLLELAGESEQALALQRERELETIDKSLRPFRERFWALQDEAKAQEEAAQAGREYAEALASARDSLGSTFDNISSYLDQLRSTDKGGGTPREQLVAARSAFNEQLQLARSGDRTALQNITQYADRLIDAQRGWSASGGATASIIERIKNQLGNLPDQVSAEQFIADEIKQALIEQTAGITSQLADVLRSDTPSNIAGALAGSFDDLTRGIGDVLTREQLAIVMDGKATDAQLDAVMRAVDLNGDGVMSGLESVIIKSMPTDATLANALRQQLQANGNKALTAAQVHDALSPIASNERINQLIDRIDVNGDGLLSAQEITSARIGGLSGSIAQSLSGYFDELDANLDGKLTFDELSKGLDGLATDAQLRAMMQSMDIDMDGVISGLESVIISEMPTDARLGGVLKHQMEATRRQQLTHAEVREALKPIASKAVINRLINRADRNADGVITAQELANARLDGLASGIGGALSPMFDSIDTSLDGLINYDEFGKQFAGMASDAQLKRIFDQLDTNGDGTISRLESLKHSSDEVGDNTKSIEERALDQVSKLGDLVTDMTASTNQLVSLDSSVSDLAGVIGELNALQQQRAQEERQHERKMAQMAYYNTRQAAGENLIEQMGVNQEKIADARSSLNQNQIEHLTGFVDSNQAQGATAWMDQEDWERIRENIRNNDNMDRAAKQFVLNLAAYRLRNRRLTAWENIVAGHEFSPDSLELSAFAKGGVFTNSVVDEPTLFNMGVMGEANPEAIMPLHRAPDGGLGIRAELPPIPALPLLGQNDIVETLQDLYREVAALRAENKRLLGENNEHLGAANRQRGEGMKRQIEATERGNESLDRISSESQLMEAAR